MLNLLVAVWLVAFAVTSVAFVAVVAVQTAADRVRRLGRRRPVDVAESAVPLVTPEAA